MDRGYYNEDMKLEELIRDKADQYSMYPSEKVWKGISSSLHRRKYFYGTGLLIFLALMSYVATDRLFFIPNDQTITLRTAPDSYRSAVGQTAAASLRRMREQSAATLSQNAATENLMQQEDIASSPAPAVYPLFSTVSAPTSLYSYIPVTASSLTIPSLPEGQPAFHRFWPLRQRVLVQVNSVHNSKLALTGTSTSDGTRGSASASKINWLQENAVYRLMLPTLKRLSWQLSVTPAMNYRKLIGQRKMSYSTDVKNVPLSLNLKGAASSLVTHKPAMGLEVGSAFLYALNKRVSFKTGVQFNYSSYDIEAFSTEGTERATISLRNVRGAEELTSYTRIGNFGGTSIENLKNEYYHLSAPIGLEWTVIGRRKLQVAVAGTLQPTYLLNRNSYLLTSDFKNYTREPSLVSRWNTNTSVEAFVSYTSRGLKFQVGPQFRYQLLSSFKKQYPVREYLMEYGLKFAVSRQIK
ncbi:MAG: hypothetical protein ACKO6K_05485 [Chitinophagaceae bacterium]